MWPSFSYETCARDRDPEDLALIPKSRRRKILPTYEAAVPAKISDLPVSLSPQMALGIAEVEVAAARFDEAQAARAYNLPVLLLRSESSSSSQIERLASSVRNVALAELTDKAPSNALLIANNVASMREVLGREGSVDADTIRSIHSALMVESPEEAGFRSEQVWIGGMPYSPHGATFVSPQAAKVAGCIADLVAFGLRDDIPAVAKAAIFHAQFETIHPFTDGNGRTGRALLHRMLAYDEVPLSWQSVMGDRADAASQGLPALLVEQPVVNTAFVAERLGMSDRTARTVVSTACERDILSKIGNAQRGAFYQATDLIEILEGASNAQGIRRMAAR